MTERLTIVALGAGDEALALRGLLESMTYQVRLLRITVPSAVPAALIRASQDDVVILSAQGGVRGFFMGTRDDTGDGWLSVKAAFEGVKFRADAVLISTACATRESGLVETILKAGGHLIAPVGHPESKIILPWIAVCMLGAQRGATDPISDANALVGPDNQFSYG